MKKYLFVFCFNVIFAFLLLNQAGAADNSQTEAGFTCNSSTQTCINLDTKSEDLVDITGVCPTELKEKKTNDMSKSSLFDIPFLSFFLNSKNADVKDLYKEYGKSLEDFNGTLKKRVAVNSTLVDSKFRQGMKSNSYIFSLSRARPFIDAIEEFDKKMFLSEFTRLPVFKAAFDGDGSEDFLGIIRDFDFETSQDKDVKKLFLKKGFKESLEKIQTLLKDKTTFRIVTTLGLFDLTLLDKKARRSAIELNNFFEKKGINKSIIRARFDEYFWSGGSENSLPLQKGIPLPKGIDGVFAERYREIVQDELEDFLKYNVPSEEEIKKVFKGASPDLVDKIQNSKAPVDNNSYDDWIGQVHAANSNRNIVLNGVAMSLSREQLNSIDAVARTLWGEARSCESLKLPQFDLVGIIIAKRALSIKKSMIENKRVEEENQIRLEKFKETITDDSGTTAGFTSFAGRLASVKSRGLAEFGRSDKQNLLTEFEQAISRPLQFSCYNSFKTNKFDSSIYVKDKSGNIPTTKLSFKSSLSPGDNNALFSVICPDKNSSDSSIWKKAVEKAAEIVLDTKKYLETHRIDAADGEDVMFYTHDFDLPFAEEVKADHLKVLKNGKMERVPLIRPDGNSSCDKLRLFKAKNGVKYL